MVNSILNKYGHQINNLISDCHSIYRSKKVDATCTKFKITQKISPPGQHQLNGLAEINIKIISAKVTYTFLLVYIYILYIYIYIIYILYIYI